MGSLLSTEEKFRRLKNEECERSSFDIEEQNRNTGVLPAYWPVGGKVYCKFARAPLYGMQLYAPGPVISESFSSKKAVFTRLLVTFFESK